MSVKIGITNSVAVGIVSPRDFDVSTILMSVEQVFVNVWINEKEHSYHSFTDKNCGIAYTSPTLDDFFSTQILTTALLISDISECLYNDDTESSLFKILSDFCDNFIGIMHSLNYYIQQFYEDKNENKIVAESTKSLENNTLFVVCVSEEACRYRTALILFFLFLIFFSNMLLCQVIFTKDRIFDIYILFMLYLLTYRHAVFLVRTLRIHQKNINIFYRSFYYGKFLSVFMENCCNINRILLG